MFEYRMSCDDGVYAGTVEAENKIVKVLVSACLTGCRVRYDGGVLPVTNSILKRWQREGRVVPFCPELAGGLPVPRPPAEIVCNDGITFPGGGLRILTADREDVTEYFLQGAREAVELARVLQIKTAVLKDGSPSCGSTYIYDGRFSGVKKPGRGITTARLEESGIRVYTEKQFREADAHLNGL